jgi:hypothetical protein
MGSLFAPMRANLSWYVPLSVAVLFLFVIPDITTGYQSVLLVFHRFSWLIFISPAAYLFFSCVLASVFLPIRMLLVIPALFDHKAPNFTRRYLWSFIMTIGIAIACFSLQIIIWGSFPLPVDREGYIHVRMIPLFPWPEAPLFG